MAEQCPKCQNMMVLQKVPATYMRPVMLFCQKCQTTIFLEDESQTETTQTRKTEKRTRILIVDDDTDILEIMEMEFLEAGLEPILANDGDIGFQKMLDHKPDAVIIDIFLPTIDGWDLSKKIRDHADLKETPIVLFTGLYTGGEYKSKSLEIGVDAFITKPCGNYVIIDILNRFLFRANGITSSG